jgi:aspartate-semialdehyde dehydrogenase
LLAVPRSPALALALALQPIAAAVGVARVGATVLEGAGAAGKRGMAALYHESIAVFNQQAPPESTVFAEPIAFDCASAGDGLDEAGRAPREAALARDLALLLGGALKLGVTIVQVPIFVGLGAALAVETERELSVGEAEELLRKAPGVEVAADTDCRASTRSVAGRSSVLVGRLRVDPSAPRGLLLWLVADPLRLAASHAIELALRRLA